MSVSYDVLTDFGNLYEAHRAARMGKSGVREVIRFEMDLAAQLMALSEELGSREYSPGAYSHFFVYEPKLRSIYAPQYRDRVVQHALCDCILAPTIEPRLIYDNAACRVGKGTHFALRRLTQFLTQHYRRHGSSGYFLKCDIRQYFASIRHEFLKDLLAKVFTDANLFRLLCHIIDSYHTEGTPGVGIPLGNQTSQWFALLYLDGLDRLVKEQCRVKYYTRYMDDMVLVLPTREEAVSVRHRMESFASKERGLSFNAKTQVSPISAGVKYLGWHFYLTASGKVVRKLDSKKKARMRHAIKTLPSRHRSGELSIRDIQSQVISYAAHLEHGHTYALRRDLFSDLVL